MKKSRFSESQIIRILKEADGGRKVVDICREHGVSQATYYQWNRAWGQILTREVVDSSGCDLVSETKNISRLGLLEVT